MRIRDTGDLWWKNAVIYCLDVETFMDWDDDGIGDFGGLVQRIDHLADLGVTCLWLMPFYPTADLDDGYDIKDFLGVDPRLGDVSDFVELIRTARDRGIRVIADLVVNHTSDQHPWFKAARRSKDSPYRDFYVWRADEPPPTHDEVMFPDEEQGIWTYDEQAGEWYRHRFYRHQPDLNTANPQVRDAIAKSIGYWMQLGLSGFRVDAVPYFVSGTADDHADGLDDPHDLLRELRGFLGRRRGDAILMGEVNVPYEEQRRYFGVETRTGDEDDVQGPVGQELTLQLDFNAMQYLFLSLARQDVAPLVDTLRARPAIPRDTQWATFLRSHDELTLDRLTDEERQEIFAAFGPEPHMQIFDRGLRRRLPPMLDGDPRRLRNAYSLLFALPGTPVLFYGEEIGMGENLDVPGRLSVRTPMQWTAERNAGFSRAQPRRLVAPPPDGGYAPEHVNVADQRRDPDSMYTFMQMLIRRYRECPELGWGEVEILEQPEPSVLAMRSTWQDASMVTLHNIGPEATTVTLELDDIPADTRLVDLLQNGEQVIGKDGKVEVTLDSYGYRWLRISRPESRRLL
ncbi:trehalose synthase [Xylanimonas oleitrophica]|uniref:Trehalose synthase n=1 Tax=Xylanimonas oleitrophica TaxID=2607479 RepID=A0A2W5WKE5_9MICO|nr:alpha-amylase family protein [Xylanimonas oleitrophica]PZR51727.1 trehalose synthase [Xylanimonas oleitrophica]